MLAEVQYENVYQAFWEELSESPTSPIDATDSDIYGIFDSVLSGDRVKTFCEHGRVPLQQRGAALNNLTGDRFYSQTHSRWT